MSGQARKKKGSSSRRCARCSRCFDFTFRLSFDPLLEHVLDALHFCTLNLDRQVSNAQYRCEHCRLPLTLENQFQKLRSISVKSSRTSVLTVFVILSVFISKSQALRRIIIHCKIFPARLKKVRHIFSDDRLPAAGCFASPLSPTCADRQRAAFCGPDQMNGAISPVRSAHPQPPRRKSPRQHRHCLCSTSQAINGIEEDPGQVIECRNARSQQGAGGGLAPLLPKSRIRLRKKTYEGPRRFQSAANAASNYTPEHTTEYE